MKITLGELRRCVQAALVRESPERAIEKLWSLPDSDVLPEEDTKQNPIHLASPDDEAAGNEALLQADGGWSSLQIDEISFSELTTIQDFISANHVQSIINGGVTTSHSDPDSWQGSDLPIVFRRISGTLVLMDGNHRAVADMLQGQTKLRARIIEERPHTSRER